MKCDKRQGLVLGAISSFVWLCFVRSRRLSKRPNIQPNLPDTQPKEKGHFVQLSKGRTFYRFYNEKCSSTLPAIILCHGFMGSSEYLIPLIETLLPTNRRIYALDLYGRGYSDCVDEDNSYDLFSEQISELLDKLEIQMPVDLVGYSMGGGIVVHFGALKLPLLRSLTLIAPVGLPSMTIGPSYTLKLFLRFLKHISFTLYGGYLHEWVTAQVLRPSDKILSEGWSRVDTPRYQWYKEHMIRRFENEKDTLPRAVASTILNLPFDGLSESYAAVGMGGQWKSENAEEIGRRQKLMDISSRPVLSTSLPVLAMWGESDRMVPCDSQGIATFIPHACVLTWPGEGHMLPVELAEEVGKKMMSFWQHAEI